MGPKVSGLEGLLTVPPMVCLHNKIKEQKCCPILLLALFMNSLGFFSLCCIQQKDICSFNAERICLGLNKGYRKISIPLSVIH